jgi:hypothetical protein
MVVCEQCGARRVRSWIVERAQGRLVITECLVCGTRTSRWFSDPLSAQQPSAAPPKPLF